MNSVEKLKDSFKKIALILSQLKEDPDIPFLPAIDSCSRRLNYLMQELDETTAQSENMQQYIYQILNDLSPIMEILSQHKEKYASDTKQTSTRYQALQSYKRYKM